MDVSIWDVLLVLMVSGLVTAVAYVRDPKGKAFFLSIPIPFSFSYLSLGRYVDVTNVTGLLVLLAFTHLVRILHAKLRLHIIPSILISAAFYCLSAFWLAQIIPRTEFAFWVSCAVALIVSIGFHILFKNETEKAHKSELPLYLKLPLSVVLVTVIVALKQLLQGFMTLFPMVGTFTSYEGRHSLGTNCRQIPITIFLLLPMLIVMKLAEGYLSPRMALLPGGIVFLIIFIPYFIRTVRRSVSVQKGSVRA
jgi:hypothetical protein